MIPDAFDGPYDDDPRGREIRLGNEIRPLYRVEAAILAAGEFLRNEGEDVTLDAVLALIDPDGEATTADVLSAARAAAVLGEAGILTVLPSP